MRRKSHELQWLELLFNRSGLNEAEIKQYQKLQRGFQGEVEFDKIFDLIFGDRISFIDDLTLRHKQHTVQLDKLFCINGTLYIVDMKNYRGHYIYEKSTWKAGHSILSHDILEQLRRAVRIVEAILFEANINVKVQGVLVFMNPESTIEIREMVKEKTVLYGDTLSWFLELRNSLSPTGNTDWIKLMRTFEIDGYKTKKTCSQEQFERLTKGIMCHRCGQFDMKERKYTIVCSACGSVEVKETAYVRTICEYGLLMHDKNIRKRELKKFIGESQDNYLKMILGKHLKKETKQSGYENKGVSFDIWFKDEQVYFSKIEERKTWRQL